MSGYRSVATPEPQQEQTHGMCRAGGCKLRGTIDNGNGWLCFVHANAPDWRQANDALRAHARIVFAIDKVLAMGDADWSMGGWKKLDAFFAQPQFKPSEPERSKRRWYEYRLRYWLLHLAGVGPAPEPRAELANPSRRVGKAPI